MGKDIDLYRQYNQHRFKIVENVVDKMASVVTDLESVHCPQRSANVQTTNAMVESLVDVVSKLRDGPQTYDVATPVETRGRLPAPAGGIESPGLQGHVRPLEHQSHATLDKDSQPYASGPKESHSGTDLSCEAADAGIFRPRTCRSQRYVVRKSSP